MYLVTALLWRLLVWPLQVNRVLGREHIPKSGPFLIIANHPGTFDPWTVVCAGNFFTRSVHWLAHAELYSREAAGEKFAKGAPAPIRYLVGFVVSMVVKHSRTLPVVQGGKDEKFFSSSNKEMMRSVEKILKAGGIVGAFPNGTRGEENEFYASFVRIAKRQAAAQGSPFPILPVTIQQNGIIFHRPIEVYAHFDRDHCDMVAKTVMRKISESSRGWTIAPLRLVDRLLFRLWPIEVKALLW